jgi:hypothetical protein
MGRQAPPAVPNTRTLTIIAQDPSIKTGGRILTAEVEVPAEELADGPCGYRVHVIDYDVTTNTLYRPARFPRRANGILSDPYKPAGKSSSPSRDRKLLGDPRFHAQNVYAIIMRTLARFEFALGRRVAWGSQGHQLHVAPHAFADANAFYTKDDRGIFFGYFTGASGKPIFTCLSHDVVAHETTHALLDGLRGRYMEPSSPDQAAFHEGFADVIALLSVFSLPEIVATLLDLSSKRRRKGASRLIDERELTREALQESVLFGLAEQMGSELSQVRGEALRRSVKLPPGKPYMTMPEFQEPHRRGELLVAAMMNAFLDIWLARLDKIGKVTGRMKDRSLVVEEGSRVADHLLTMAIRAIDYCPPTDINFADYLSALLTIDHEVVPDDTKYNYRGALLKNFAGYGIKPARSANPDGTWRRCDAAMTHGRTHFESMLHDKEEVFRFIWENRTALDLHKDGYAEVESVRACIRIGPDGFALHETVAEYVEILTLRVDELKPALGLKPPLGLPEWQRVRVFGGGALIFDEYGQLKYQISNRLDDKRRQQARLDYLTATGFFDAPPDSHLYFAKMHLARATG